MAALAGAAGLGVLLSLYLPIPRSRLSPLPVLSLRVLDREGRPLREVLSDEGGRCRWVPLGEVSPFAVRAAVAAEDRRFFFHNGVDIYAIARALGLSAIRGLIVSGASTITQQVVRNIYHFPRTWSAKLAEAWLAVRLEHTLSKAGILAQYLNRIAYGRQAYGLEAAARLYFDKPARDLSPAEAAYLTILPRAPGRLRPDRDEAFLRDRRDALLRRMARLGFLDGDALVRALDEPVRVFSAGRNFEAPHFVEYLVSTLDPQERASYSEIRSTLDLPLQQKIEGLLYGHIRSLEKKGLTNGAVVVLENDTGAVRAMVGSRDYRDEIRAGQVNGALALRQPGSTLKPLTYALALEKGMTAATLIDDSPLEFAALEGTFSPENYDERYHGPVRLRSALASSYNIPAAAVLDLLGPDLLYRKLKDLGFLSLQKDPAHYGVGLTLGNGEVTLLELARAYAAFARGGVFRSERLIEAAVRKDGLARPVGAGDPGRRVFSEATAAIITDILADRDARVPTFGYRAPMNLPFPAAAKTGTSKDFRDNWTVGYTPRFTVAVWVGNFDGSPMHNVSGVTGAGPLFRDVMVLLEGSGPGRQFPRPQGLVRARICPLSGELPSPACPSDMTELFAEGTVPRTRCRLDHLPGEAPSALCLAGRGDDPIRIVFPGDGDFFKRDSVLRDDFQKLTFRVRLRAGLKPKSVAWYVNEARVAVAAPPYAWPWPIRPGVFIIKARIESEGDPVESRPVRIRIVS